jgi:dihydroneopterin aldolase
MFSTLLIDSDTVSLAALHLAATVGPDQWQRTRPQPIQLSLHLHLAPLYLDTPGRSDDVADSLHYGHLAKAVERRVDARAADGYYASARALVEDVTDAAFGFARDAVGRDADAVGEVVHAVRVVLSLPKQILLAGGFEVELTTRGLDRTPQSGAPNPSSKAGAIVRVTDLILPVLIGVNPPERLAKQRLVTDLTFFEAARTSVEGGEVDYAAIVQQIATASHSCLKVVRPTLIDD